MVKGISNTFTQLNKEIALSNIFLKVEVYNTNFQNPKTQYINSITANNYLLSNYSFPIKNNNYINGFFVCLGDKNITPYIDHEKGNGSLTINIRATRKVNTYPYNGYLLYVRVSISGMISPTGQPTSQPSSQPTGQPYGSPSRRPSAVPSSIPSSQPSCIPTLLPSSQPTLIPSVSPSSQPSSQPSSLPTLTPSTSYPSSFPSYVNPNEPFVFIGGNYSEGKKTGGMWSERTNWNRHRVPTENSTVNLILNNNERIYIKENTTVRDLNISGNGILYLTEGVTLVINNLFEINNNCSIKGTNNEYKTLLFNSSFPIIKILKKGQIFDEINNNNDNNSYVNIFLESLILVNKGNLIINPGNLLLSNTTILNTIQSEISFFTNPFVKNILRKNSAFYNFEIYNSRRLNQKNVLRNILLPSESIYDIKIPNAILVQNSGKSLKDFYGIEIMNDGNGVKYYGDILNITNNNETLYIKTLLDTNIDLCSIECLNLKNCLSFDYNSITKKCYLSTFYKETLGGLIPESNQWTHYELNNNYNIELNSYLIIYGIMKVNNTKGFLDIHVSTHFGTNSKLISTDGSNLNFFGKISTSSNFEAKICGGTLSFHKNEKKKILNINNDIKYNDEEYNITNSYYNSSYSTVENNDKYGLNLVADSSILAQSCYVNNVFLPVPSIIFKSGNHDIYGDIKGNYSLITTNSGVINIYQNISKILHFYTVLIKDSSTLNIKPINITENKKTENNIFLSIMIDTLIVKDTGSLLLSSIRSLLTAQNIEVHNTGLVSGQGAGKKI